MTQRIEEKIKEIENYLRDLKEVTPEVFKKYEEDLKTRAACERCFEKVIESATDLAFIIIKYKKFEIPNDDKQAFDILFDKEIIDSSIKTKLKEARGMRNIIAHQYGNVDNEIVFKAITKEISKDVNEFLKQVKNKF